VWKKDYAGQIMKESREMKEYMLHSLEIAREEIEDIDELLIDLEEV